MLMCILVIDLQWELICVYHMAQCQLQGAEVFKTLQSVFAESYIVRIQDDDHGYIRV